MPFIIAGLVHVARWVNIRMCLFLQKVLVFLEVMVDQVMSGKGEQKCCLKSAKVNFLSVVSGKEEHIG
jgi:hypothetical protein